MFTREFLDAYHQLRTDPDKFLDFLDPQFDDWPPEPTPARIAELRSMPYDEYRRTKEWKQRARATKTRAGNRCALCNKPGPLHAHHRTYERRGNERPDDLIALCPQCHQLYHDHKNGKIAT